MIIKENGLRKVLPYYSTNSTFVKGRWIGKSLHQLFQEEFQFRPIEYYKYEIENANIKVNSNPTSLNYIIQPNDVLSQLYHYHENPVAATNIDIIYQDSEMLLISKPAGIPIHPTGKYHFNSCTEILKHEHGFGELYPVNRLDMLTSGLTILAKTKEKASEFGKLFAENKVEKMYIALVNGEFPLKSECKEPLLIEPNKHGHVIVSPSGKESMTEFKRRFFNGETSLVECYPKTGRTHQIRVHLQYLGYPIVNDPIYGTAKKTEHPLRQNTYHGCYECKNPRLDPTPDELYICLHSTRYIIADMRLEAPPPDWAGKHF